MNPTTKFALRTAVQASLEQLNPAERDAKSSAIRSRLIEIDAFQSVRKSFNLMIYLSFGNEVQTMPLVESSVIVPFCEGNDLVPFRIFSPDDLEPNRWGILEPKPIIRKNAEHQVAPEQIDFVIVPGLAFDRSCHRLGRGKGYYDRFLRQLLPKTSTVGFAFEYQIVERIPTESWDQPVSFVITENRIIRPFS